MMVGCYGKPTFPYNFSRQIRSSHPYDNVRTYSYDQCEIIRYIKVIFQRKIIRNTHVQINDISHSGEIASISGHRAPDWGNLQTLIQLNLDFNLIKYFDPQELSFIICHELGHIYHNHMLVDEFIQGFEKAISGEDGEHRQTVESIKMLYMIPNKLIFGEALPFNGSLLKNTELDADEFALSQTGI